MVNNFLSRNKDKKLRDLDINESIMIDSDSLKEYQDNIVLKERVDARTLIIGITPVVLQVNLKVIIFDSQEEKNTGTLIYEAKMKGIEMYKTEHIGLEDQCITVILKYGHYDLLYSNELMHKYPFLVDYDKQAFVLYEDPSAHGTCTGCNNRICEFDNTATLSCGHLYHSLCLMKHVEECNLLILL